jgi:hypothetical protein
MTAVDEPADGSRSSRWLDVAVLRTANRAAKAGIGVSFLAGVRRRDPSVVVNGVLSFAFTALPRVIESGYDVRFQPWHRLWVSAAALVHVLGMLGPYDRVWWWDHLAHTLSGVVVAGATDVVLRARTADADPASEQPRSRAAVVAGVTLAFGVLWEALEYGIHAVAGRLGFEPLLVHYGRRDALGDLFFDLVGAGLVVRFGRRAVCLQEPTPADEQE